jgi:uroporphyrinogen decarboxylase
MTQLFMDAALGKETKRPPVWFMRQAGRYMPVYRKLREKHSFKEMMSSPDLVTEITLQPIHEFQMDAAILFCDILITADALGCPVEFIEKRGPVFKSPIRTMEDVNALSFDESLEDINFVFKSIPRIKKELVPYNIPLIGFAGSPFTVASYMIEGQSSKDLQTVKMMSSHSPEVLDSLLRKLTDVTICYINKQIEAGAEVIQLFDTWSEHLSWDHFKKFSYDINKEIITAVKKKHPHIPLIFFSRGSSFYLPMLTDLGADVLSMDWRCKLKDLRKQIPANIGLQGNLDPLALLDPAHVLERKVKQLLTDMSPFKGYIFNLGHGIIPQIPMENIRLVVETIKAF